MKKTRKSVLTGLERENIKLPQDMAERYVRGGKAWLCRIRI